MGKESVVEIPENSGNQYRYVYSEGKTAYLGPVGQAPPLSEHEFFDIMKEERYGKVRIDVSSLTETDKAIFIKITKGINQKQFDPPLEIWMPKSQVRYYESRPGRWIVQVPMWLAEDRKLDPNDFWSIRLDRRLYNRPGKPTLNDIEFEWLKKQVLHPKTKEVNTSQIAHLMWKAKGGGLVKVVPEGASAARIHDKLFEMFLDHEVVDVIPRGPVPGWTTPEWKGSGAREI